MHEQPLYFFAFYATLEKSFFFSAPAAYCSLSHFSNTNQGNTFSWSENRRCKKRDRRRRREIESSKQATSQVARTHKKESSGKMKSRLLLRESH